MKISGGLEEDGIVVGNAYDKYGSRNPVVKYIMSGFENALSELVNTAAPGSIHEIGCGEGFHTLNWRQQGLNARGSDFSSKVIEIARSNAQNRKLSADIFTTRSIYDLQPVTDSADLIICCEVLEHLEHPELGLQSLQKIAERHLILSVPREPVWRTLNMLRGKYLAKLGNTPGHIQHWSSGSFINLVSRYFTIDQIRSPLPWTMLLCSVRN